jgi:hypothetical protein
MVMMAVTIEVSIRRGYTYGGAWNHTASQQSEGEDQQMALIYL